MMSVISPERAREQLALMYVNRSQGITGVQLVEKNGENELVVDILAPFWTQVGGRLPKTWGGLKVSVAIFDATGEPYPAWLNLQHNSNRPALVFSEERDPYGPPPPRRRSQGSPFGPPPRIRVSEPSRPPVARAVMALLLLLGSFFLLKFSIGWAVVGFLSSGFMLGTGIKASSLIDERVYRMAGIAALAMCALGTYLFFLAGTGALEWVLGAITAFSAGQLTGMFLRAGWDFLREDAL
ncbi:MAG TPA: hypothetical protein V6D22_23640 [Candidatus Obscuribacterales bacterium]